MRKLLILGLPCLVLGLAGAASAAESGARHGTGTTGASANAVGTAGSGAIAVGTTKVGTVAGLDTVTADRITLTANAQGVSGAAGGMEPVIHGQPVDADLGTWHNDVCRLDDRRVGVTADCSQDR